MSDSEEIDKDLNLRGKRKKIGAVTSESYNFRNKPEGLTDAQNTLREAAINHFRANSVRKFITKNIQHINSNRQVADGIRFLFDENGNPPANAPLEEIIAERKKIEAEIRWFEAMRKELESKYVQIKEIEELALELMNQERE